MPISVLSELFSNRCFIVTIFRWRFTVDHLGYEPNARLMHFRLVPGMRSNGYPYRISVCQPKSQFRFKGQLPHYIAATQLKAASGCNGSCVAVRATISLIAHRMAINGQNQSFLSLC